MIAVINVIACTIFELLSSFEKKYTKNDETMSTFIKITILQYFNISIVILIIGFNLDIGFLNIFGIFAGDYFDFSVDWYRKIGSNISMTLLIATASPHAAKIGKPIIISILRWRDRGWKSSYHCDDGSNKTRTKQVLQTDVESLYIGEEIASFYVYA